MGELQGELRIGDGVDSTPLPGARIRTYFPLVLNKLPQTYWLKQHLLQGLKVRGLSGLGWATYRVSSGPNQGLSRQGSFPEALHKNLFHVHPGCWKNPVPCVDRTLVPVSLLAVRRGHV